MRSRRGAQLENAAAYLELHIEQGPVLEASDLPLGVVLGTFGVERHQVTFRGQAAHAGSTPMDKRRDALAAAAKLALEIRGIAASTGEGAVCTMGSCVTKPGIVTSVVETATVLLDQRHLDAEKLAAMLAEAKEASERFAREEDVEVEWERVWRIDPILFDEELIELADEAVTEVAGQSHRLPSGPLHDAAEVARAGVPTVMLFVQSLRGLSHTKLEDTKPEHLELSVQALDRLAAKTIDRLAGLGLRHARPRGHVVADEARIARRPFLAHVDRRAAVGLLDPANDPRRPSTCERPCSSPTAGTGLRGCRARARGPGSSRIQTTGASIPASGGAEPPAAQTA